MEASFAFQGLLQLISGRAFVAGHAYRGRNDFPYILNVSWLALSQREMRAFDPEFLDPDGKMTAEACGGL